MTDDEIDAAIRAAVPEACFAPNAVARAIYLAGYRAGIEAAANACVVAVPRAHTYASENADLYIGADNARDRCINAIRALAD